MTIAISSTTITITLPSADIAILKAFGGRIGLTAKVDGYVSGILSKYKHSMTEMEREILRNDPAVIAIPKDESGFVSSYMSRPEFALMLASAKP